MKDHVMWWWVSNTFWTNMQLCGRDEYKTVNLSFVTAVTILTHCHPYPWNLVRSFFDKHRRSGHNKTALSSWQKQSVSQKRRTGQASSPPNIYDQIWPRCSSSLPSLSRAHEFTELDVCRHTTCLCTHTRTADMHNTVCIHTQKPITTFHPLLKANLPRTKSFHTRVVSQDWLPERVCVTMDCTSVWEYIWCVCGRRQQPLRVPVL